MVTISIRPAQIEDLKTLLTFEQGVIEAEKPLDPFLKTGEISYYNIKEMIAAKNTHLLVAFANNEMVGSGYVRIENSSEYYKNKENGYVGFMYVKPSYRGKRISNMLLESLKDWAKKKRFKRVKIRCISQQSISNKIL
jgi:GNAT superfamily N-acetyltransferase